MLSRPFELILETFGGVQVALGFEHHCLCIMNLFKKWTSVLVYFVLWSHWSVTWIMSEGALAASVHFLSTFSVRGMKCWVRNSARSPRASARGRGPGTSLAGWSTEGQNRTQQPLVSKCLCLKYKTVIKLKIRQFYVYELFPFTPEQIIY